MWYTVRVYQNHKRNIGKEGLMKERSNCDYCENNVYDEELDDYVCAVNLDEDELARFMAGHYESCPYFRFYDEYKMVRKQN